MNDFLHILRITTVLSNCICQAIVLVQEIIIKYVFYKYKTELRITPQVLTLAYDMGAKYIKYFLKLLEEK